MRCKVVSFSANSRVTAADVLENGDGGLDTAADGGQDLCLSTLMGSGQF